MSVLISQGAHAEDTVTNKPLPKWEFGMGFISLLLPDYPASKESSLRFFPAPYFVYRGDVVKADRQGGIRTKFFDSHDVQADLSFGAGLPSNASDNMARQGMGNIDWLGEVGPRVKIGLFQHPIVRIRLEVPVRYVFSTDLQGFDSRGYITDPGLNIQHRALFDPEAFFNFRLSFIYATEDLMDYFYEVPPELANGSRAAYDAQAGYVNTSARLSLVKSFGHDVWLFLGFSKNYYADSKNRSSPLVTDIETESYYIGGAWSFWHSRDIGAADSSTSEEN